MPSLNLKLIINNCFLEFYIVENNKIVYSLKFICRTKLLESIIMIKLKCEKKFHLTDDVLFSKLKIINLFLITILIYTKIN